MNTLAQTDNHPMLIDKETIPTLSFKDTVIVPHNPDLAQQIEDAVRLGNAYHTKVSIIFFDDFGLKRVETTLWANGDKFVCLKGGVWLPIARIVSIHF